MIDLALDVDPEPLAFRVRPQPGEGFDSWIARVATRHEVNRTELFRHLGIEAQLAQLDLARGERGLGKEHCQAAGHLIERLAWAVQTEVAAIQATFVSANADVLLPRAMRRYGCPQCWHEWLCAAKPLVILRAWIFRLSWHCERHQVLLADLGPVLRMASRGARLQWLASEARRSSRLFSIEEYKEDMLALNRRALGFLQGASAPGYPSDCFAPISAGRRGHCRSCNLPVFV